MPTTDNRKVRLLLKAKKAKVVKHTPFTIMLLHSVKEYKQDITLGVDAGSKTVGLSASTEKAELFAAELKPRNDVVKLLKSRSEQRRGRRSRKTRYRAPRFSNRAKPKGWTAPSINVKIHNHIQGIALATQILPITYIVVETAEFDTHLLKSQIEGKPAPVGVEYQHGEQYGYYNTRQYILWRDAYKCASCKGKSKEPRLHVIRLDSCGGDAPNNLVTVCKACSELISKGLMEKPQVRKQAYRGLKDAVFMGIMRDTLIKLVKAQYPYCEVTQTTGAYTKMLRESAHIPKSHINDAFSMTEHPTAARVEGRYLIKPVRRHNRQIHKATINKGGTRKLNQTPKYTHGYQLFDRVRMPDGQEGFVFARRSSGSFDVRKLEGTRLSAGISSKKLKQLDKRKSLLIERSEASSPSLKIGVSAA
jgi:N6-L-threonylcarbamoyladenine synthase